MGSPPAIPDPASSTAEILAVTRAVELFDTELFSEDFIHNVNGDTARDVASTTESPGDGELRS